MALAGVVLVPLVNPGSMPGLVRLAARLASEDAGVVAPLTVIHPDASADRLEGARQLVAAAEDEARTAGVEARGLVVTDASVASAVLQAAADVDATLVLMGWRGFLTRHNVFGELIDSVVGRSAIPLAIVRLDWRRFDRIVLPVTDDHLLAGGDGGVQLAAELVRRLRRRDDAAVLVLRTGEGKQPLPDSITGLSDRVHHDTRRIDLAVGAAARSDDLIVVPVVATAAELRTATTHVPWAAPQASVLVAIDVAQPPQGSLAAAVTEAGEPPPPAAQPVATGTAHVITVSVGLPPDRGGDEDALGALLRPLGQVREVSGWTEADEACLRAIVEVRADSSNAALASVMTAVHEAREFRGAQIRYELA